MEKAKQSVRFETVVDGQGRVVLSKYVDALKLKPGSAVTIKIYGGTLSKKLSAIGVTDEEIETIGEKQLEERENVISFLSAQGALKRSGYDKRVVRK